MSKLVLNVKYLLFLSFLTAAEFYNLWHIQGIMCLSSKEIIFSALYYFQIWFLCRLKESKQTFNTKFVIQCPVQTTWTRHCLWISVSGSVQLLIQVGKKVANLIISISAYRKWPEMEIAYLPKQFHFLIMYRIFYFLLYPQILPISCWLFNGLT